MDLKLNQQERIIVSSIYFVILIIMFNILGGNFKNLIFNNKIDSSIWFYAGAFMIILGSYIVEPFFTKPSDAIVNAIAVIISLLGLSDKKTFIGYNFIIIFSFVILILAIILIFIKDSRHKYLSKIIYYLVEKLGSSKVIFSIVYLSAAYSYFANPDKIIAFISILSFWVIITFFDIVGLLIKEFKKIKALIENNTATELGIAIGCDNPLLYDVEIDHYNKKSPVQYGDLVVIETSLNIGSIGMVINKKYLLNKQWISVYLLQNNDKNVLKINLKKNKVITDSLSIFSENNSVYKIKLKELDNNIKSQVKNNPLYQNKEDFIGYVTKESNINSINFVILRDLNNLKQNLTEGTILKTKIYNRETLYQVIDGNTKEEHLQNFDSHGYFIGIARKLGHYNIRKKELNVSKWMPTIYSPLFFAHSKDLIEDKIKDIALHSIGRLPQTDLDIPLKDINSIVTHNTAILGILGIGKSCLAYELIQKITSESIKVICIDITNQYYSKKGLINYISEDEIINDFDEEILDELKGTKRTSGSKDNPNEWGNENHYKNKLDELMKNFLESDENKNKKVLILNPDWHPVAKAGSKFKIERTVDLTAAEKTRLISERLFVYAMKNGQSDNAKYLLVYEEAHSLVPEWSSAAYDGDKKATNGTAKVILQGRKYGLGCLIVTQRTANVSKSILNQCNTIFALRVFDDTGKGFLENYIGEDYANTLPTLEERHAIAIGKGLKLKQPVILQLNDMKYITR
ncbi:MAG: ATP-binding protein [bacterium]